MALTYAMIHEENGVFGISFPDFPGCVSTGHTPDEVLRKGSEALTFHVAGMAEDGDSLPDARGLGAIRADPDFADENGVWTLVEYPRPGAPVQVDGAGADDLLEASDAAAKAAGMSRSAFLAAAAREKLRAA